MHKIIAERWHKTSMALPCFDCIVYATGAVTVLDCYSLMDSETRERRLVCAPLCDTTIESVEKYNAEGWSGVDPWTRIAYDDGNLLGGGGANGSYGFIARVDADNDLIWAMFFSNTNPIKNLTLHGDTLTALNEHGELRININLKQLTEIKMTVIPRHNQT